MNNCMLMAEIIQDPQLRYTSDTQTPISEMTVQFEALRTGDAPETLKVIGWGNLAQEIQERCHQGDRILVEGRLSINSFDRPEGFREKRAEMTAQRIHFVNSSGESLPNPSWVGGSGSGSSRAPSPAPNPSPTAPSPAPSTPQPTPSPADYDDIPF